jgi:hypothetical protein
MDKVESETQKLELNFLEGTGWKKRRLTALWQHTEYANIPTVSDSHQSRCD